MNEMWSSKPTRVTKTIFGFFYNRKIDNRSCTLTQHKLAAANPDVRRRLLFTNGDARARTPRGTVRLGRTRNAPRRRGRAVAASGRGCVSFPTPTNQPLERSANSHSCHASTRVRVTRKRWRESRKGEGGEFVRQEREHGGAVSQKLLDDARATEQQHQWRSSAQQNRQRSEATQTNS